MRNVTVSLDDDLARWARIAAAERDMSLSRFVASVLRERMSEQGSYETAMRQALAVRPRALKKGGRYPRREELHDRSVVRRHERARVPTGRERG